MISPMTAPPFRTVDSSLTLPDPAPLPNHCSSLPHQPNPRCQHPTRQAHIYLQFQARAHTHVRAAYSMASSMSSEAILRASAISFLIVGLRAIEREWNPCLLCTGVMNVQVRVRPVSYKRRSTLLARAEREREGKRERERERARERARDSKRDGDRGGDRDTRVSEHVTHAAHVSPTSKKGSTRSICSKSLPPPFPSLYICVITPIHHSLTPSPSRARPRHTLLHRQRHDSPPPPRNTRLPW